MADSIHQELMKDGLSIIWYIISVIFMGESFQDYSWIQDFEADFPHHEKLPSMQNPKLGRLF